jgi:hypothetical protein
MKHHDQASPQDIEKRMRILDEYNRIRDEAAEKSGEPGDERAGEEVLDSSPSSRFFLAK